MKHLATLFIIIAAIAGSVRAFASDDNIYIAERNVTCQLSAGGGGRITGARISQEYRLGARRVDGTGLVVAFYDQNSKVDNASCTGGKPQYRAWENGDIFYSGTRACLLPVEVKTGKMSQARVQVSYASPEFLDDILLMSSLYDIDREKITVRIPAESAGRVSVDLYNGTGRENMVHDVDDKGNVTVTLTVDSMKAFRREALMPDPATSIPLLRVNAAFTGLDELYSYLKAKLEPLDTPDAEIASLAASLASEAGSDTLARVDAVARWVRANIRYVAIEHGELAHKPVNANDVLRNRYGDCKGSANLICALLRAMGIDGRRVWIGTRGGVVAPFSANPSLGSANHMIAAACVGDSIVYIDGTVENAPRGFVPSSIAGQECLVENGDSYLLTHVGPPYPARSVMRQTGLLKVDGNTLCGDIRYDLTGGWKCMIETILGSINAGRRPQAIASFISRGRKSITVETARLLPSPASDSENSVIEATLRDNEAIKAVNSRAKLYVMPRLLQMAQPQTVDARKRTWPINCDGFMPIEADIIIELPQEYRADELPKCVVIDNPWFEGRVDYTPEDETSVRCTASLRQRRQSSGANEARAWNEAVKEVEKASNTALILLRTPAE